MKANDLIKKLKKLVKEHGDLELLIGDRWGSFEQFEIDEDPHIFYAKITRTERTILGDYHEFKNIEISEIDNGGEKTITIVDQRP